MAINESMGEMELRGGTVLAELTDINIELMLPWFIATPRWKRNVQPRMRGKLGLADLTELALIKDKSSRYNNASDLPTRTQGGSHPRVTV